MIPARAAWLVAASALAVAVVVPAVRTRLVADPSRVAVQAQADYAAGRYDRAEAGLVRLATLRPPSPMDRMARALVARARGHLEDALAELGRIPRDHRLSPMAELLAGRVELQRRRAGAAEAHFLAALRAIRSRSRRTENWPISTTFSAVWPRWIGSSMRSRSGVRSRTISSSTGARRGTASGVRPRTARLSNGSSRPIPTTGGRGWRWPTAGDRWRNWMRPRRCWRRCRSRIPRRGPAWP